MMKGDTPRQFMAWRPRQMPEPCVTSPHSTISNAFCSGAMMCSHTPETTRPIAKPDRPEVRPPKKAAARKSVKVKAVIAVAPKGERAQRLDKHLTGRRHGPRTLPCLERVSAQTACVPSAGEGDGAWAQ